MKRYLLAVVLLVAGCTTTQQTIAYKTIGTLEQGATSSYDAYFNLVLKNQLPTNGLPAASAAFNHFQDSAKLATLAAMNNTNALAPASLADEESQLLKLISGFETTH